MLTQSQVKEIKKSEEYQHAFQIALSIHQKEHESQAIHFRNCEECKSGFTLLFIKDLKNLRGNQHES